MTGTDVAFGTRRDDDDVVLGSGALHGLRITLAEPVDYALQLGESVVPLNPLLGSFVRIRFDSRIDCRYCGQTTRKSYGAGYCYPCFKALARCDLCVVSPVRCHYAAGTCREPAWGEAFCMQPHVVYVANSAGAKVGITKPENLPGRWLDQGATQACVVMRTQSRHQAGCVEAVLSRHTSDRTDWRALIARDAPPLDLRQLITQLRTAARAELAALASRFPGALDWVDAPMVQRFSYPVTSYTSPLRALSLVRRTELGGRLLGVKGQYLMFDSGVFNVRKHSSYHVEIARTTESITVARQQLELF